jgi:hypothetical protein
MPVVSTIMPARRNQMAPAGLISQRQSIQESSAGVKSAERQPDRGGHRRYAAERIRGCRLLVSLSQMNQSSTWGAVRSMLQNLHSDEGYAIEVSLIPGRY